MRAPPTGSGSRIAELLAALEAERRLLDGLREALGRQRDAVSTNDIDGVEAGVRDVQRILLTLSEAQARRRSLSALVTGSEETDLDDLAKSGGIDHDGIARSAQNLLDAAGTVSEELDTTRTLLRGVIANGDHYMKTMTGVEDPKSLYGPDDSRQRRQRTQLVDHQI